MTDRTDAAREYERRLAEVKAGIYWLPWLLDYLKGKADQQKAHDYSELPLFGGEACKPSH